MIVRAARLVCSCTGTPAIACPHQVVSHSQIVVPIAVGNTYFQHFTGFDLAQVLLD
jgi:hypothetical protein